MLTQEIEYRDGEHILEATTVQAKKGKKLPTVVICHAWRGKDSFVKEKAKEIASWGYHAIAIDVYGKGIIADTEEESSRLMNVFIKDRAILQKRLLASIQFVKSLPYVDVDNIIVIGFCFGGLCALDIARSGDHIKGAVSFHGILKEPSILQAKEIKAKLLILHGDLDTMVSKKDVITFEEEMTTKKADWQLIVFSDTYHAFTNPEANNKEGGTMFNSRSCERAFNYFKLFAKELFT